MEPFSTILDEFLHHPKNTNNKLTTSPKPIVKPENNLEEVTGLLGEIAQAMGMRKRDAKLQDKKGCSSRRFSNNYTMSMSQDSG